MNDSAAEIERIVRNVLTELGAAGASPSATVNGEIQYVSPTPQTDAAAKQNCVVAERVVTLATLDARLNGASVLTVPRGAVITPAVRDELKARSIRLEFADAASNGKAEHIVELLVGVADIPDDVSVVTGKIQDYVAGLANVQSMQQADLRELVGRMAEWIASRNSLGVVLTRRPAAAACLANRRRQLRAVWANTPKALIEAMNTIAPNVVTYNPADHAASAQRALLQEFARGGVRECPEGLDV